MRYMLRAHQGGDLPLRLLLEIGFHVGLEMLTAVILLASTSTGLPPYVARCHSVLPSPKDCDPLPIWSKKQRNMASLCCGRISPDPALLTSDVLGDVGQSPQTLSQR
jgi:hypothetical protein